MKPGSGSCNRALPPFAYSAHRDYEKAQPHAEELLLIEWPRPEKEPTQYWVSTLPPTTKLKAWIQMAKHRWILERDYEELKQELV